MKHLALIVVVFLFASCETKNEERNGRPVGIIYIDVFEKGYYTVNGDRIASEKLEETISTEADEIEKLGFARDEIIVNIVPTPEVKVVQIIDIQVALKELKLRKVFYGDPDGATEKAVPGRSL
ncbi:hypothetical protein [Roseivirga thermotolerans]|uniref:DUF3221 domain-containing protein n=1 Tax=Roseivirga thermotolerans TaxID=1758176 RepID=A0ABQ3I7Y2_9BACT|nr:hypothetical protein [Roseivirga thermotolerans]MEC7755863.1 hypothetical protein [Bacteroidota bacterium]GHE72233.1 hypothetical protein GCM10011340_30580 [Roseivirga thermotolerans]